MSECFRDAIFAKLYQTIKVWYKHGLYAWEVQKNYKKKNFAIASRNILSRLYKSVQLVKLELACRIKSHTSNFENRQFEGEHACVYPYLGNGHLLIEFIQLAEQ